MKENRKGGYTRIIKAGLGYGTQCSKLVIEFVDRDLEARRQDKKKKDLQKIQKKKDKKQVSSATKFY